MSVGPINSYDDKGSFGWECFRTKVTVEILLIIPSRPFPLPLGRGLLFTFRRQLSSIFEVQVLFIFRYWWFFVFRC